MSDVRGSAFFRDGAGCYCFCVPIAFEGSEKQWRTMSASWSVVTVSTFVWELSWSSTSQPVPSRWLIRDARSESFRDAHFKLTALYVVVPPREAVDMATVRAREALVSVNLERSVGIHAFSHGRIRDNSCLSGVSSRRLCIATERVDTTAVCFNFPNSPQKSITTSLHFARTG